MKNQYIEWDCLKWGAWTVCRFDVGGGLGRKGRGGDVFEWGVATPMHTMDMPIFVSYCFEVR